MKGRYRIIFDLSGIVLLLPVLTVFVWLSSDGHIYFQEISDIMTMQCGSFWKVIWAGNGFFKMAFTMKPIGQVNGIIDRKPWAS